MQVVVLPSWYPRHATDSGGIFFREQAIALARAGLNVEVIAPRRLSLRQLFEPSRPPFDPAPRLVESRRTYVGPPRAPALDAMVWRALVKRLYADYLRRHGKPDILHAHSFYPAGEFAISMPARAHVITEHASAFLGPRANVLAKRAEPVLRQYNARIAVGQQLLSNMERLAKNGGAWSYIPNLVNTRLFSPSLPPSTPIRILTVANLLPNKRVDWVIRAFDAAFPSGEAHLFVVGAGVERAKLEELSSSLRSAPRIHFLGELSRQQVKEQLDLCSMFALASREETFGVVLIEALSMGRPIVATDSGGPASIVSAKNGVLVGTDDFLGFQAAIERVASSLSSYDSAAIRMDCVRRFGEEAVTDELIKCYREALRGGRATP